MYYSILEGEDVEHKLLECFSRNLSEIRLNRFKCVNLFEYVAKEIILFLLKIENTVCNFKMEIKMIVYRKSILNT